MPIRFRPVGLAFAADEVRGVAGRTGGAPGEVPGPSETIEVEFSTH